MVRSVAVCLGSPVSEPKPVLHVCTTCRAGLGRQEGIPVSGLVLHDRVVAYLAGETAIDVQPVECLAVCNDGCAAAISMPGKWSYLLGRLTPDMAQDLVTFAHAYAFSRTGTVMPSRRPASLATMILGRVPSLLESNAQ